METELLVVMPVFNEETSVLGVIEEWLPEIGRCCGRYSLLAIDDGSTDRTLAVLQEAQVRFAPRIEIQSRPNRGHGQTCLEGYRVACSRGIPWVFQIDSDGQCAPEYFQKVWEMRFSNDVIYGHRVVRDDGWRRLLASAVLKMVLLVFAKTWCVDANVPYRLMRTERLSPILSLIPDDFFLANIALAVQLRRAKWRQQNVPIRFRERFGGEPTVKIGTFGSRAQELVSDLQKLSFAR